MTFGVDSVDLQYSIQYSDDLINWATIPAIQVHGQIGDVVQISLFDAAYQMLFTRLRVSGN